MYLKRRIKGKSVNIFHFRIQRSKKMGIWIGAEERSSGFEWWFRLDNGSIFRSD